jgi:hypothetical protein
MNGASLVPTTRSHGLAGRLTRLALATLVVFGSPQVSATLGVIEQAYELNRSQVQLPTTPEGGLAVRPCPGCRPVVLRVNTATSWFSSPGTRQPAGQAAVLAAFRVAANNPNTLVYVYYDPQTLRVKRVVLDAPAPRRAPRRAAEPTPARSQETQR